MERSDPHQRRIHPVGRGVRATMRVGVMMILASAMRHSVGRPATGMGGGTLDLWSGRQPPSAMPLDIRCETEKSAPLSDADFVVWRTPYL